MNFCVQNIKLQHRNPAIQSFKLCFPYKLHKRRPSKVDKTIEKSTSIQTQSPLPDWLEIKNGINQIINKSSKKTNQLKQHQPILHLIKQRQKINLQESVFNTPKEINQRYTDDKFVIPRPIRGSTKRVYIHNEDSIDSQGLIKKSQINHYVQTRSIQIHETRAKYKDEELVFYKTARQAKMREGTDKMEVRPPTVFPSLQWQSEELKKRSSRSSMDKQRVKQKPFKISGWEDKQEEQFNPYL